MIITVIYMNKLKTLILSIIISSVAASIVYAWTNPSDNPPLGGGVLSSASSYPIIISSSTDSLFSLVRIDAANPVIFKVGIDSAFVINAGAFDVLTLKSGNVGIGIADPGTLYKLNVAGDAIANAWLTNSDIKLKENIASLSDSLVKTISLRGVNFNLKGGSKKQIGFIAQDVENILPEAVYTDSDGYKSIAYDRLTAVLAEAVKELNQKVEKLEERIKELEK